MRNRKPTLSELFIAACKYTGTIDSQRINQTVEELRKENNSFYERTVRTFIIVSESYYSDDEIKKWVKDHLTDSITLPELK